MRINGFQIKLDLNFNSIFKIWEQVNVNNQCSLDIFMLLINLTRIQSKQSLLITKNNNLAVINSSSEII